jgi:ubiquinone/menaquinone biosynthesis C-methylase UbiE
MRRFSTSLSFGDPKFWRAFYAKREGHFEWFCEYSKCQPALKRHIDVADRVLHVGCGTSALGSALTADGFPSIVNIDLDPDAIARMRALCPGEAEQYQVADVLELPFADRSFDVILDKGTIDAIAFQLKDNMGLMLNELDRVLVPGGRLVQISDDAPEWRRELVHDCLNNYSVQYSCLEPEAGFEYYIYAFTKPG